MCRAPLAAPRIASVGESNGKGGKRCVAPDALAHDDSRKQTHHVLCSPSYAGWRLFADRHGFSITSLMDAIGHTLGELAEVPDEELGCVGPDCASVVSLAKQIELRRKRRPK